MPRLKKPTPKKKATLVPEPKWDRLRKAKTEQDQYNAFLQCEDYVHYEVTDKERLHSMKKWVRDISGWDVPNLTVLPDTYLLSFAKQGWKFYKLGYMPERVAESLRDNLYPLYERAVDLREKIFSEPTIHPSVSELESDHKLHPDKVKTWISAWKNNKDDASKRYVSNMQTYLRTGVWLDACYGLNREYKAVPISIALAYDREGIVKRTKGVYYPDLGLVWK
jgi:hypothetical protein